jgi:hypothetical protein
MNDRTDHVLRDVFRAETAALVDDARPEFRAELRDRLAGEWTGESTGGPSDLEAASPSGGRVSRDRRYVTIGLAAATVAVLAGGLLLIRGSADDGSVPAERPRTVPVATIEPTPSAVAVQPTSPDPVPTRVTVEPTSPEPVPTTVAAPTEEAVTIPAPRVDELAVLGGWLDTREEPITIDELPHLLLSDAGLASVVTGVRAGEDPTTELDGSFHSQVFVDVDRPAVLRVNTWIGPLGSGYAPVEFTEELDTERFALPWQVATRRTDLPAGDVRYALWDGNGSVSVEARGLTDSEVFAVASALQRRGASEHGWVVAGLPDGMMPWREDANRVVTSAWAAWSVGEEVAVEAIVSGAGLSWWNCCVSGPVETPELSTTTIDGRPALVEATAGHANLFWELEPGILATVRATTAFDPDPVTAAIRLAESARIVDRGTWLDTLGDAVP